MSKRAVTATNQSGVYVTRELQWQMQATEVTLRSTNISVCWGLHRTIIHGCSKQSLPTPEDLRPSVFSPPYSSCWKWYKCTWHHTWGREVGLPVGNGTCASYYARICAMTAVADMRSVHARISRTPSLTRKRCTRWEVPG